MRLGEIITAAVLALLSIYLMFESTDLNVGYIQGEGPGGGAWPFWLSGMMLVCTGFIAYNWYKRTSPPSQSTEPVLDSYGRKTLIYIGIGLVGFVGLINVISMYGAMLVFLIYYLKFLGRHSWGLTLIMAISMPIGFFFFFEGLMRINMPKGLSFTDPIFNVLYDIIY